MTIIHFLKKQKSRILYYIIGNLILSLGSSLVIKINLGTTPWYAMTVGLKNHYGLTIGTWVIILCTLLAIMNSILLKKFPEISCIITILLSGFLVDWWMLFVFAFFKFSNSLFINISLLVLGIFLMCLGIVVYLKAEFGKHPLDNFMLVLTNKFKLNLFISRTIIDGTLIIIAFLLHGPITFVTFIVLLMNGFIIHSLSKFINRFIKTKEV